MISMNADRTRGASEADGGASHAEAPHSGTALRALQPRERIASEIVVSRPRTDGTPAIEMIVAVIGRRQTAQRLREALYEAQRGRGRGPWSDTDSLVRVGGELVGRVRSHENIEDLVERVLDRIFHDS